MPSRPPRKGTRHRRGGSSGGRRDHPGPRREHVEELHPVEAPPEIVSFAEWDLGEEIQRAIANMDITVPTPIQALSIGPILEGRDVIAKAETGTGKTLAFGAPIMGRMDPARATVLALVMCPTRELAQQVASVLEALALPRGLRVALVVGGDPMHPQVSALQSGAQVVVGTPGRILDLYEQKFLSFPWTEYAVLDEADKMFEIGFLDEVKKILSYLPEERQTLLFSATFPTEVLKLARAETRDPVEVATAKGTTTVDSIDQSWIPIGQDDRPMALMRLFEQSGDKDVFLVFCERRTDVDRLMRRLERLPFDVRALHGGYDQAARFRVMSAFRTGDVKALVATDVASRGLDVQHVTHVINFSVPRELEDYAHRIGRTGRAGRSGTAITFVTSEDARRWRALSSRAAWDIREQEPPGRTGRGRDGGRGRGREREREERPRERNDQRGERPAGRDGGGGRDGGRRGGRGRRRDGEALPRGGDGGRERSRERPERAPAGGPATFGAITGDAPRGDDAQGEKKPRAPRRRRSAEDGGRRDRDGKGSERAPERPRKESGPPGFGAGL